MSSKTALVEPGAVAGRYTSLEKDREPFLRRARDASKYTLPALYPPEGFNQTSELYQPFQSVGSRGVNNLASKLLLALMPPNTPFWRMDLDAEIKRELEEDENTDLKSEMEQALARYERAALAEIEASGDRSTIFESLKHLIVGGNVLINDDEDQGLRFYTLDRYVCTRDKLGSLLEIIISETFHRSSLPEDVIEALEDKTNASKESAEEVTVYTAIRRNPNANAKGEGEFWEVWQELTNGTMVPDSDGTYRKDELPYLALRLAKIDGEDYGRGFVEEYIGDLKSLESLSQSMVEGSAAAAKVLFLVQPNSSTHPEDLARGGNGAIVRGHENDVTTLQVDKHADFRTVLETMNAIEGRLNFVFLNHSSVQRDAERVTAAEVRYMAQELEDALGGVYSILSQEFQRPYVELKLQRLEEANKLPELPRDDVNVTIVAGLEALGRGHDRMKLVQFTSTLVELSGGSLDLVAKYMHVGELIKRLAVSDGIDTIGLIKKDEEIAAQEQQDAIRQLVDQLGPEALKQFGEAAREAQSRQAETTPATAGDQ